MSSAPWKILTSDGLVLSGILAGPTNAPTVVLLHGAGQTRHAWSRAVRPLVDRGYRVLAYDARGHGDSDWCQQGNYHVARLAEDLREILVKIPGRVALVGASLGGTTGFYAVGSGVVSAEALVLVDIALRPATTGLSRIYNFMTAHRSGFGKIDEAVRALAAYDPDRPEQIDPTRLRNSLRERDGRLYWHWDPRIVTTKSPTEEPETTNAMLSVSAAVRVPLLLAYGGRSDVVDAASIAEFQSSVPHAEIWTVPTGSHMITGHRNDSYMQGILDFLGRHFNHERAVTLEQGL